MAALRPTTVVPKRIKMSAPDLLPTLVLQVTLVHGIHVSITRVKI
jgi:hypothetical protein